MLNTIRHDGPSDKPPLVIAHGLFGSARNFGSIARSLAKERTVICVDMRNHGDSPWFDTHSYPELAADLAEVAAPLGTFDLMGHSMGGKSSMTLALTNPGQMRRLVVADIAPVAYDHSQSHQIDALEAVDLSTANRRSDAARQLQDQGVDAGLASFFTQSLDVANKRWKFNLATLRAEMPKLVGFPDVEGSFDRPTFFLSGAVSDYVRPEYRAQIKSLFPAAVFAKLPEAGHFLHADRPKAFEAAVATFLAAPDRA